MPPNLFLILAILLVVIGGSRIPLAIVRWIAAFRMYGGFSPSLALRMLHYARRSRQWRAVYAAGIMLVLTGGAFGLYATDDMSLEAAVALVGPTLYFATGVSLLLLPPSALFLSSSSPDGVSLFSSLSAKLSPHRIVALLRVTGEHSPAAAVQLKMNIIRTDTNYEWRSTVFHLMDVVPLMVIDLRHSTDPLDEELRRIAGQGYGERVIEVNPKTNLEALPDQVLAKLREPRDVADRRARQRSLAHMWLATGTFLYDPATAADYVIAARCIQRYAMAGFLRDCKQGPIASGELRIYEQLPTSVGRAAELQYLKSNRALEEVELILRSAREDQQLAGGQMARFNVAVATNSLGVVESLRCNWTRGVEYFHDAIRQLNRLRTTSDPDLQNSIHQELATAYFNLGDVFAGRYVDEKNGDDRLEAIRHYEESVRIDRQLNADVSTAQRRISEL